MATCPFCRGDVPAGATKCQHCGEWLDREAKRRANGELHPVVKLVAVLLMVAVAVAVVNWAIYQ